MTGPPATDERIEQVARIFHDAYERLAPDYGYRTREASAVPWEQVPSLNRQLMIATVGEVLDALASGGAGEAPAGLREAAEELVEAVFRWSSHNHLEALAAKLRASLRGPVGGGPGGEGTADG